MLIKLLTVSVTSSLHQRRKGKAEVPTAKGSTGNSTLSQNEAKLFVLANEPAILTNVVELLELFEPFNFK